MECAGSTRAGGTKCSPARSGSWAAPQASRTTGQSSCSPASPIVLPRRRTTTFDGGSDDAGFVQIMAGSVTDRVKAEAMETPELLEQLRAARPDLLGGVRVWFDDGSFVEAAYFTSEEDARKGEASSEFTGPGEDFAAVYGEMTFTDLRDPLLISP